MIETFKEFTFEAAHALPPYSGMHGHTFKVGVYLRGEPDPVYGWPVSLYDLDQEIEVIRKTLDHHCLNEVEGLAVPSLENVAKWIYEHLDPHFAGLDRIVLKRGIDGQAEGCMYQPKVAVDA
jgi:6-pyruvoyltetrahydropterin/6-carboxytetrahydropterin synthase